MSLLIGDRLEALRSAVTTSHRSQFRRLHEQCEWSARQVLPEQHPSASITWLGAGAPNLALAHLLTGQPWYLTELRRWLRATCALPHWGKEHMPDTDLDAGWLCFGLALVENWVGHLLPAAEHSMLQAKLALQAERLHQYIEENRGAWWADAYWQNHNWICYSGLAAVGYALPGHPGSGDWTAAAAANARELRRRLPADGADGEGVVYWRYGVPWLAAHADLMRTADDPDGHNAFKDFDFLRQTFWYRLHQAAPGFETIIDHGDCHDRRSGHSVALYYKLASEYGIGEAQWLANRVAEQHFWREAYESGVRPGVMPEAYLEFLWFDETIEPVSPAALPTGRSFADLGLLATRTSWRDDANMVSVKASPGSGHGSWREGHVLAASGKWQAASDGHSHPDMGAFVVIGGGEYLAIDEGYSSRKLSGHHNVVLVDGRGMRGEGSYSVWKNLPEVAAPVLHACAAGVAGTGALGLLIVDTAPCYPPELGVQTMLRTLLVGPGGELFIDDRLEASAPREWSWLLHSDVPATQETPQWWTVRKGFGSLTIDIFEAGTTTGTESVEVSANPTSSTPSLSITRTMQRLRSDAGPVKQARFTRILQPRTDPHGDRAAIRPDAGNGVFSLAGDCAGQPRLAGRPGAGRRSTWFFPPADDGASRCAGPLTLTAESAVAFEDESGGGLLAYGASHLEIHGRKVDLSAFSQGSGDAGRVLSLRWSADGEIGMAGE